MSNNVANIDKNFAIKTGIQKDDIKFYNAKCGLFDFYGLYEPYADREFYIRMPEDRAKAVSAGVGALNIHTSGGRIRFTTNSRYLAIQAEYTESGAGTIQNMAIAGSSGYDVYHMLDGKEEYFFSFIPPVNFPKIYEAVQDFPDNSERELTINFPLYSNCMNLFIGVEEGAYIKPGPKYKYEKPIVYYGSSITQGGCASHPGNTYQGIISRHFNTNFTNLGFSGSAKGEVAMAEYLSELDMSIFVCDYDHNASPESLRETHEPFFKAFRKKQPNTPVILMSRPTPPENADALHRKETIYTTYMNAKNNGDNNVYFIYGQDIYKPYGYFDCTVDTIHPNDLGFYAIAQALIKTIEENNLLK